MSEKADKLDGMERASLSIILQSYKSLLQDEEIMAKLNLSSLQKKILFNSIEETIEEILPKMMEGN